jgi:O-antigen ligase
VARGPPSSGRGGYAISMTALVQTMSFRRVRRETVCVVAAALALDALLGFLIGGTAISPKLAAATIGLCLVLAGCVLAPWHALLALAAVWGPAHALLLDFEIVHVGSIDLRLSRAVGLAVLCGFALPLISPTTRTRPTPGALKALCAFVALYVIEAFAAPSLSDGAADLVRLASGVAIAVLAFHLIDTPERLRTLLRVVMLSGFVVSVVVIVQFVLIRVDAPLAHSLFGNSFYETSYASDSEFAVRVTGTAGGPSEVSALLLVVAMFTLLRYTLGRDELRSKSDVLILMTICVALILTLTRTTSAALVLLFVVWAAMRPLASVSAASLRVRLAAIFAIVAVALLPFIGAKTLQARLADVNPHSSGASFAQGRGAIWRAEIHKVKTAGPEQLLVGHGAHTAYVPIFLKVESDAQSPHNIVLWLLVETGLVGLGVYLAFVFGVVRSFWRASRSRTSELARKVGTVGMAAIAAYSLLDFFLLTPLSPGHRWYYMLFVGATLRFAVQQRETHLDDPETAFA